MEESDNSDLVRYEKFVSVMTDVLVNKKYKDDFFIFVKVN